MSRGLLLFYHLPLHKKINQMELTDGGGKRGEKKEKKKKGRKRKKGGGGMKGWRL